MKSMSVRQACNLTGLSPSVLSYRPVKHTRQLNTASVELVRRVVEERPFYGSRRVAAAIRRQGIRMNRKAVQRIMSAMGWALPVQKKERAFAGSERIRFIPTAPDQLWETDITYVWCGTDRWCYLFNILDCFTREWLAYVFARDMRRQHAIDCLLKATEGRDLSNLVLRSDNGSQFSSGAFMESVKALGIRQEFIANSTPEQQGHIESFHSTLKTEYIWPMELGSYGEAAEYMPQVFCDYNKARLHSAIGYTTPGEFYMKWKRQLVPEVVTSNLQSRK